MTTHTHIRRKGAYPSFKAAVLDPSHPLWHEGIRWMTTDTPGAPTYYHGDYFEHVPQESWDRWTPSLSSEGTYLWDAECQLHRLVMALAKGWRVVQVWDLHGPSVFRVERRLDELTIVPKAGGDPVRVTRSGGSGRPEFPWYISKEGIHIQYHRAYWEELVTWRPVEIRISEDRQSLIIDHAACLQLPPGYRYRPGPDSTTSTTFYFERRRVS